MALVWYSLKLSRVYPPFPGARSWGSVWYPMENTPLNFQISTRARDAAKSEGRRQKAEGRRQKSVVSSQWAGVSSQSFVRY
jgi:hypothetical protein